MTRQPTRVLTLRIDEDEPIAGSLEDARGASREFSGWIGLARALELVLAAEQSAPGGAAPPGGRRSAAGRERPAG